MSMIAPEVICSAAAVKPPAFSRALGRFRREEDGSLLIFGLFAFVMMLLLAGVSLDLMRFEERRTTLQNTVDRASLAAADLKQTLDPKDVVRDYFQKAGLTPPAPEDIIVTQGTLSDYRKVEIKVSEEMPTWFMALVGVKTLSTPAASTAEESVGQIEISLILDVSGSMNSNSRLTNLKPAAKSFVDQIFDSAENDKVSISIIPYATQVAISDDLASYFNMTVEHSYSNCIEFEESKGDFDTAAVSFGTDPGDRIYQRNGHFDPFYKASPPNLTNCPAEADRELLPFSGDRNQLKTFIDGLSAEGNTSIDIGMKWGAALLDPSMQGVVDGMIASGDLPGTFSERPYAYTDGDVLKIIVLMTDGANTTEYRLRNNTTSNPYFDEGVSLLTRNPYYETNGVSSDDYTLEQYSLWDASKNQYYIFALNQWRDKPWGDSTYTTTSCNKWGTCTTTTKNDVGYSGSPTSIPMTWPDVWAQMSIYYFSDNIIYKAYGSSSLRNQWRPSATSNPKANTYINDDKDALTLDICGAAKNQGVRIYTIAFEAPTEGQQLLNNCQNAGYYAVEGLDINDAFAGIVNSINKLRLTH
ncbi:pilus assembly protein TadG-related protein [Defluviimonas sp. SAOS-178_SWC]|uniref:pilus assembly protein TadG-related protein n=1 Tax=Defluviimonas sp. SAOS-178_SWC TaxID=3121287 RepID=UPI003221C45C